MAPDGAGADPSRTQATGIGLVLMTLVGWSSVPLFLRYFAEDIDGWTSNGWRYGAAAVMWLPVLLIGGFRRSLPAGLFKAAIIPSVVNAIGQVCFTWAHYFIDPGLVTFSLRVHIVCVTIGAAMLFPAERAIIRRPLFLAGMALVIGGTIATMLLAPQKQETAATASGYLADSPRLALLAGVGLAVAAGVLFACYALSVRKLMQGVNSIVAFAAISQYTAAAMIALMLLLGTSAGLSALPTNWSDAGALTLTQFALVLFSAVIGIALGHVGYYMSINRLGVAVASGVIQLQPFCVAIASLAIFGEVLTGLQWTTGSLAVVGAGAMLYTQHRAAKAARAKRLDEFDNLPPDHVAAAASGQRVFSRAES
ncbi:MAG: DMT family transporter [Planctomycetota bacterium]